MLILCTKQLFQFLDSYSSFVVSFKVYFLFRDFSIYMYDFRHCISIWLFNYIFKSVWFTHSTWHTVKLENVLGKLVLKFCGSKQNWHWSKLRKNILPHENSSTTAKYSQTRKCNLFCEKLEDYKNVRVLYVLAYLMLTFYSCVPFKMVRKYTVQMNPHREFQIKGNLNITLITLKLINS